MSGAGIKWKMYLFIRNFQAPPLKLQKKSPAIIKWYDQGQALSWCSSNVSAKLWRPEPSQAARK
jgi:hypothetical protein